MIKIKQIKLLGCIMGGLCLLTQTAYAGNLDISENNWEIKYDQATKSVDYIQSGKTILADVFVKAKNAAGAELLSSAYTTVDLKKEAVQDNFGAGNKYTYTYKSAGKESLEQVFYFYAGSDYFLTEANLLSDNSIGINWISPLMTQSVNDFLPTNGDYRVLDMPFDNDSFRGYSAQTWSVARNGGTSCEASAIYDVNTRNGLVVGSVEHCTWKTGIFYQAGTSNKLRELRVFGGLVDARTNDVRPEKGPVVSEHGKVYGKRIKSPKIFVGYFNDWRNGMEKYGEANAIVAPKLPWAGGTIFGWQSWGGMAERVNYEGACDVSDFFAKELGTVKNEQGTSYMILDSFWDNMTETQLRNFVKRCLKNGQIPGIYFCPFSFWGGEKDLSWGVNGSSYTYNDIVLKAGGKPRKIESYALDPTHPGTKKMIELQINKFKELGYKYVKIDFVNNAALEADSYYDKNVTTGMQAYNAGLKHFNEAVGGEMFINLSIAPVFPSQYTHGRRISCDAWGAVNQSQYVLNSMNLSWWLEHVYSFNDPDHIVYMQNNNFTYTDVWLEGANRIRTTTGMMCGTMVLGDNFSLKGTAVGTQKSRDKAKKYMSNEDILNVARIGKMFRPVEGSLNTGFSLYQRMNVDKYFTLETKDAVYLVAFNYSSSAVSESMVLERIGIPTDNVKDIKELWTGETVSVNGNNIDCKVPAEDVRVYRISKKILGVTDVKKNNDEALRLNVKGGSLEIYSPSPISSTNIYSTMGQLQLSKNFNNTECFESVDVSNLSNGLYIASVKLTTGSICGKKFIK